MFIQSLELVTGDPDSLKAFYVDKLGLSGSVDASGLSLQAGTTALTFRRGAAGVYHFAFNIPENRIDDAVAWLQSLGISPLPDSSGAPTHEFLSWNADAVYFLDPAQNVVELIARHELSNSVDPDQPFTAAEILCVSEIGLPTADVLAKADSLCADYGLCAYREVDETFAPIGDANGLLILVPVGRTWYPTTDSAAAESPLRVTFAVENGPAVTLSSPS